MEVNKLEFSGNISRSILDDQFKENDQEYKELEGMSLGFIPNTFKMRRLLHDIISHPHFDQAILVNIFISALLLALDSPTLDQHSRMK